MLLGDTVANVYASPRNSTWFTRPFSSGEGGVWGRDWKQSTSGGGEGLGMVLQLLEPSYQSSHHPVFDWFLVCSYNTEHWRKLEITRRKM